jgi:hypothetical protein
MKKETVVEYARNILKGKRRFGEIEVKWTETHPNVRGKIKFVKVLVHPKSDLRFANVIFYKKPGFKDWLLHSYEYTDQKYHFFSMMRKVVSRRKTDPKGGLYFGSQHVDEAVAKKFAQGLKNAVYRIYPMDYQPPEGGFDF